MPKHNEGFRPEWCISTMICGRDIPFWGRKPSISSSVTMWGTAPQNVSGPGHCEHSHHPRVIKRIAKSKGLTSCYKDLWSKCWSNLDKFYKQFHPFASTLVRSAQPLPPPPPPPPPLSLSLLHQSVDHKLSILQDQDLRESLRRNGIKVSTDLTPCQRDEIHDHKQQVVLLISGLANYTWRINKLDPNTTKNTDVRVWEVLRNKKSLPLQSKIITVSPTDVNIWEVPRNKKSLPLQSRIITKSPTDVRIWEVPQNMKSLPLQSVIITVSPTDVRVWEVPRKKKSLPLQPRIITASPTDAPLPDNNRICLRIVMPRLISPTAKAGAILTTSLDLPGTNGTADNGTNNTAAIRNTVRLGTKGTAHNGTNNTGTIRNTVRLGTKGTAHNGTNNTGTIRNTVRLGTKGTAHNGTNNTAAIRNTVRLGTRPLTTALDMENGHKALTVALPGGIGTREMAIGHQRSTTVSPIPVST